MAKAHHPSKPGERFLPGFAGLLVLVALIAVFGTYLRYSLVIDTRYEVDLRADEGYYHAYAFNLSQLGIYSGSRAFIERGEAVQADSGRPPLFPLIASNWIRSNTYSDVQKVLFFNVIAQSLALALFSITLLVMWPHAATLVPVALLWSMPQLANTVTNFLTESLFTALLLIGIVALDRYRAEQRPLWLLLFGALVGLSSVTRGTMTWFWLFLLLFMLFTGHRNPRRIALLLVPCLLPAIAWQAWMHVHTQGDSPIRTIATLYHGSFPDLMFDGDPRTRNYAYRVDPMADYAMASIGNTLDVIWTRFVADPLTYLKWYLFGKIQVFWQFDLVKGAKDVFIYPPAKSPWLDGPPWSWIVTLHRWAHPLIMVTGFAGCAVALWRMARRRLDPCSAVGMSAILVLYATILHMIAAPYTRYSIPFKPFLVLLATYALHLAWVSLRDRRHGAGDSGDGIASRQH